MGNQQAPAWSEGRKSSYSDGANNCVEIAFAGQLAVGVWDTKGTRAKFVSVPLPQWRQFIATL